MDKRFLQDIVVLYVEDEQDVLKLTSAILEKFVKKVIPAVNGEEGLEFFKKYNEQKSEQETIDIVITDINMPKMNGLEMIEKIHQIDHSIPPIITTAHTDSDFLKKAINLRVRGYVNKPLNINNLIDTVAHAAEPKYLKEKLEHFNSELQEKIEEKTLELRSILDSQDNMILVFAGSEISSANKTFLDFFGIDCIEKYKKSKAIYESFIVEKGYFSTTAKEWIDQIVQLEDTKRVVKMVNFKGSERVFRVQVRSFVFHTKHYVVSFTDITELQEYNNKLQYQATHDNLTKLYNRQKFNDELHKEILRENRYQHSLSIIMFDIDDFKMVNDTFGHDVGDIILISIANVISRSTRVTDIVARWGGEEFMILLPETSANEAVTIAEDIRKNVASMDYEQIDKRVTISLGVNSFVANEDNYDSFIKGVDIALYKAKNNGKNQVVEYEK